jgi:hypothetical protein
MKKNLLLHCFPKIAAGLSLLLLSACAMPDAKPGARANADPDDQEYVVGSRFPVKDKSQTNVQTGADLQSSGARN